MNFLNTINKIPNDSIIIIDGLIAAKMYSVFSTAKFCPTGGIDGNSYSNYIKLPNVLTVGGSFIVNKEIIKNKEWNSITENAKLFLKKAND